MQNSNFAIHASNADAVLLDSVPHWRQFGYFSRRSLLEITSSASTMCGYASRNWLYPSRSSTQQVMHTSKITFCCLEWFGFCFTTFWRSVFFSFFFLFFDPFTNNRETSFTLSRTFWTIRNLHAVTTTKLRLWLQQWTPTC